MPSRNRVKIYVSETHYHLYNRGLNKKPIFKDPYDFSVFLNLLKRYLSKEEFKDKNGIPYKRLSLDIDLLAFCLQKNHFHLLVYQVDSRAISDLIRRITVAYTSYFNRRYKTTGPVFQESFKATQISNDEYLMHISRYIHLNPKDYEKWEFSSLPYYLGKKKGDWIKPKRILGLFDGGGYEKFVGDYQGHKKMLDDIKHELANGGEL